MDLAAFQQLLERHGADLASWPQAEREDALSLLQADLAAQDLFAEHSLAEAAREPPRDADPAAVDKIMSQLGDPPHHQDE